MSWMDRESASDEREWRTAPRRAFPLQGQWWEVTTNGEFVGVRATVGTALELRQLITALQAYLPYFEQREAAQGTEAQRATTVEQGVVYDGPVRDSECAQTLSGGGN